MIAAPPRVLVVDDDPVTLRFFQEALTRCGCRVIAAGDPNAAREVATQGRFDLALIDRRLPGSDAITLLKELRASGFHAPAIATSADFNDVASTQLRAAGFADLLRKPATLAEISSLLVRHLDMLPSPPARTTTDPARPVEPVLDDGAALAAIGGDRSALSALRALFRVELDAAARDFGGRGPIDPAVFCDRLHRLAASCGFCGALALRACATRLESKIRDNATEVDNAVAEFLQLVGATSERLAAEAIASGA